MRRIAERGLKAREALRAGDLLELPTVRQCRDTRENRILAGFINLLRRRVKRSLARAKEERDMRLARLNAHGSLDVALSRFVQLREGPKIAKLKDIVEDSESLLSEMRRATQLRGARSAYDAA